MIKFINPELFQLSTVLEHGKSGDFYKTTVSSSVQTTNQKTGEKMNRIITTILSATEDFDDSETNVAIKTTATKNGTTRVSLNVFDNIKYDTDVYLAAIPFNGFIEEIEQSFDYRIYRGLMVKSDKRNIEFQGETFKKVAYMIIVPNLGLLKEDHKYHQDVLTLKVSSYNLETRDDNTQDTVKYTTTLTFDNDGYNVDFATESVDPVNKEDFNGKVIFPIYVKNTAKQKNETHKKKFIKR